MIKIAIFLSLAIVSVFGGGNKDEPYIPKCLNQDIKIFADKNDMMKSCMEKNKEQMYCAKICKAKEIGVLTPDGMLNKDKMTELAKQYLPEGAIDKIMTASLDCFQKQGADFKLVEEGDCASAKAICDCVTPLVLAACGL